MVLPLKVLHFKRTLCTLSVVICTSGGTEKTLYQKTTVEGFHF